MSLTETAADSDFYTGTMTLPDGSTDTVQVDADSGLVVSGLGLMSALAQPQMVPQGLIDFSAVSTADGEIAITITLPNAKGTFDGFYEGGTLVGTVTHANGKIYEVELSKSFIAVDAGLATSIH